MSSDARQLLENIAYDILINDDLFSDHVEVINAIKAASDNELFNLINSI